MTSRVSIPDRLPPPGHDLDRVLGGYVAHDNGGDRLGGLIHEYERRAP